VKFKILPAVLLVACMLTTLVVVPTPVSAGDLLNTDFNKESFAKTVDYFNYARTWAQQYGLQKPADHWHAYVYMTYVNKMGLQIFYAGLRNISLANLAYLTIPMQTLLLHYKTENNSRDALVASSFLMIMGFNDTADSVYSDSPDRNDTLWASFSFGVNLKQVFPNADFPAFNSRSEVFPLTSSEDGLTWKWGMKYTNLTALWITTHITNENETDTSRPWGLATYDELTFNYTLTINPDTHEATISQDHVIGRMHSLWIFGGWFIIPFYNHYNSTGCYWLGSKISNETVYEFLHKNNVKMSIVSFQTSIMLDRDTYSITASGQNVTDNEALVSNSTISTYADDGEKIADAAFGVKETYNLFNYTEDSTESTPHTYDAIARTTEIGGYAKNKNLFDFHRNFARYLPLILVNIYPQLYERSKESITNMTRSDYLCLISYPNYDGYRIVHDPVYTVYFASTSADVAGPNLGELLVIAAMAGIVIAVAVVILKRKGSEKQSKPSRQSSLPLPPSTI
jgi:hypothetical protein